jgi:hypothetical protein
MTLLAKTKPAGGPEIFFEAGTIAGGSTLFGLHSSERKITELLALAFS